MGKEVDAASLRVRISEKDFQRQVVELAQRLGWRVATFRKVRVQRANGSVYYETPVGADGAGWPDLFLVRGWVAIAAELKVGRNRTTEEQWRWLEALAQVGCITQIWTPNDWPAIERLLA